jgi:DNA-binding PadR family transcriptional regulator
MENKNLAIIILKSLEERYLCFNDLCQKLQMNKVEFESKMLYMSLSKLQLSNLLLANWLPNEDGLLEKHFYLTRNGLKYIQQSINLNN